MEVVDAIHALVVGVNLPVDHIQSTGRSHPGIDVKICIKLSIRAKKTPKIASFVVTLNNISIFTTRIGRYIAYKSYFEKFYNSLDKKVQKKVLRVLMLLETQDRMPLKFMRITENGLYELRIEYEGSIYRIFFRR
jgi:putative component of toxin-antitoxin plasmid stabilization module